MFQKIEIEIDVPDGYEFVRYGVPEVGEKYVFEGNINTDHSERKLISKVFIVRKSKQWRDPVLPADYGKQARFSDNGFLPLTEGTLAGWSKDDDDDDRNWLDDNGTGWRLCQVCDEETK